MRRLLPLFLLLFFSSPSYADESAASPAAVQTTRAFLSGCNGASEKDVTSQFKAILCRGYLQGLLDTTSVLFTVKPESKFFCPPEEGITTDALLKIVNEYVIQHPDTLTETARMTVLIAYGQSFPCN